MKTVCIIFGTRPEIIKMAPVVHALWAAGDGLIVKTVATGQHAEITHSFLDLFGIVPDVDLCIMRPLQTPSMVVASILERLDPLFSDMRPDMVLVQGDTSTVFAASLAAFHLRIPVGHVEAGLRTNDLYNPFPEEANRRLVAHVADLHFAPTPRAKENLLEEGISGDRVHMVGNTSIDALRYCVERLPEGRVPTENLAGVKPDRFILLTCHRRESWDSGIRQILLAAREILDLWPNMSIVYPVHPNPIVKNQAEEILGGARGAVLLPPVDYATMAWLMKYAALVWTDSGGLQEEAPTFGQHILVLRRETERPEVLEAGFGELVGQDTAMIVERTRERLAARERGELPYRNKTNPFGDGRSGERIARIVAGALAGQ